MKNYFKLLKFVRGHEALFGLAIVMMLISSLFEGSTISLALPLMDRIFMDKMIVTPHELPGFLEGVKDYLNQTPREKLFWIFPWIWIGWVLGKHVSVYFYQISMNAVSQRIVRDVRARLYEKIQNLSLDFFSKKRTGELISRITADVLMIENAVSYATTDLIRQSFLIVIYLTISITLYPKGALVVLLVFPLLGYPISRLGKRLKKIARVYQEKLADITTHLIETISGIFLIKASNTEAYEVGRFKNDNQKLYKLKMSEIKRLILIAPLTEIVGTICGISIYIYLGKPVLDGELSAGVFMVFFISIMQVISPFKKLGNANALIQKALAANTRIYDVLDMQATVQEKSNAVDIKEMEHSIEIECEAFHYGDVNEVILKNVNVTINKGELVAVVGPTGTGKTTLINLIPRFYDPSVGTVKIDGVDLKNVSFKSLRSQVGIVSQDTILFNDTVRSNIAYGKTGCTDQEIEDAAAKAFALGFINKMPDQLDTIVGDRGFRLSGGEKQRLAIARAILKNAPILILDEATSQLDSESEQYVHEALDKLMVGRTVVAIAHRLSTIKKADKIVVLDKGQIVGIGKHSELMGNCDMYKRLHDMQFQS